MHAIMKCIVACGLVQVAWVEGSAACMAAADKRIWEGGIKANISTIQQNCVTQGAPGAAWYDHCIKHFMHSADDGEKCMADCVEKRTQLSAACSGCFGKIARCTFDHCMMQCIDASSPTCVACGDKYCNSDFVNCSGIADLPHPKELLSEIPSVPGTLPALLKKIHEVVCKELESTATKEEVVARVCEKVHSVVKLVPEAACETAARLLWEREEIQHCKPAVNKAAELRRWENSSNCTGKFSVLSTDNMNECTQFYIPAPASIWVAQKNDTAYSSYHCQGVTDCSKDKRVFLADFVVGTCEDFGAYSQMRVWSTAPHMQVLV